MEQTRFDSRTIGMLSSLTALALVPFAIAHLMGGDWLMMGSAGVLVVLMAFIAIRSLLFNVIAEQTMFLVVMASCWTALLSAYRIPLFGLLWAYPVIALTYYFLRTRPATGISLVFIACQLYLAQQWANPQWTLRAAATLLLVVIFCWAFANNNERQRQVLRKLASHDPLTGIRNRRELELALENAAHRLRHGGAPTALILLDLDHFKRVNDEHGHGAGDRVLVNTVRAIETCLHDGAQLFRFGGEEFAIVARNMSKTSGSTLARQVLAQVREQQHGNIGQLTVSAGVAVLHHGESAGRWFQRADAALYRAKLGGRDRVEIAGLSMSHGRPSAPASG